MNFIKALFITSLVSGLIGCSPQEGQAGQYQSPNVSETASVSTITQIEFIADGAEFVNCGWSGQFEDEHEGIGEQCGRMDKNGLVKLTPEFMAIDPIYKSRDTTCYLMTKGASPESREILGWYYMTQEGFARGHDETQDNDCIHWKYLPSNMSKTYVGGKLAYMDKSLAIVFQSDYTFGHNFDENNLAIVCSARPSKRYGPDKEHYAWAGGTCGQINLDFDVVTPIDQPYETFDALPQWALPFYSRVANIKAKAGKGEALKSILKDALKDLPGLKRIDISLDNHQADLVLVSERWDSRAAHAASLELPKVRAAITEGRALIESVELQSEYEFSPLSDEN